jgi:hypothetical protein
MENEGKKENYEAAENSLNCDIGYFRCRYGKRDPDDRPDNVDRVDSDTIQ